MNLIRKVSSGIIRRYEQGDTIYTFSDEPPSLLRQMGLNSRRNLQFIIRVIRQTGLAFKCRVNLGINRLYLLKREDWRQWLPKAALFVLLIPGLILPAYAANSWLKKPKTLDNNDREKIDLTLSKYIDPASLNSNLEISKLLEVTSKVEGDTGGTGGPQASGGQAGSQHIVQAGETLSGIADMYGMSSGSLVLSNKDLKDTELIHIGQIIVIPESAASPDELEKEKQERLKRLSSNQKSTGSATLTRKSVSTNSKESYLTPINYSYVSQGFSSWHRGEDFVAPVGTPIKATRSGCIISANGGWNGGYGNLIIQDIGGGQTAWYAHQSRFGDTIFAGQCVNRGEVIGYVGSTGRSTGAHLHFELRQNGVAFDPQM